MVQATLIKKMDNGFQGDARLYKVSPFVEYTDYGKDGERELSALNM